MKLERWLKLVDMKQAELARLVGCATPTINRHIRKGRVLTPEVVLRIYFLSMGRVRPDDFYDLDRVSPEVNQLVKTAMEIHERLLARQNASKPQLYGGLEHE